MVTRRAASVVRPATFSPETTPGSATSAKEQGEASTALRYVVPGRAVSWKRTQGKGRVRYTDPDMAAAKSVHRTLATIALRGKQWRRDGLFRIDVEVYLPSLSGQGDWDNYAKLAGDALQGVAYDDDRQVRRGTCGIDVDAANPRTEVVVTRVGDAPPRKRQRRA